MIDDGDRRRFEALALPHLDAAYNLARWLTRNDADAQDVVQDAAMRALRHIGGFRGDRFRPWWLQIVRNTAYSWLRDNRPAEVVALDDLDPTRPEFAAPAADEPQAAAIRSADRERVNRALAGLPAAYRELLVLRELEDLSYKEIAAIAGIPLGTVMSRLSRGRALMRQALGAGQRPVLHQVARSSLGGAKP